MKILVVKPFKEDQDVIRLIKATVFDNENEVDLLFADYCVGDKVFNENVKKIEGVAHDTLPQSLFDDLYTSHYTEKYRILYHNLEFSEIANHYMMFDKLKVNYDFIVSLEGSSLEPVAGYVAKMTDPMTNQDVNMVYCDFTLDKDGVRIPYYHYSAPSPLQNYPLFSFRCSILKESAVNLPQLLTQNVLSFHIPDGLVTIYGESQ